jgi:hypothetical protein
VHFVDSDSRRDAAFTTLFLGFFAAVWFGWAQADSRLTVWLAIASQASLLVTVAGVLLLGYALARLVRAARRAATTRR